MGFVDIILVICRLRDISSNNNFKSWLCWRRTLRYGGELASRIISSVSGEANRRLNHRRKHSLSRLTIPLLFDLFTGSEKHLRFVAFLLRSDFNPIIYFDSILEVPGLIDHLANNCLQWQQAFSWPFWLGEMSWLKTYWPSGLFIKSRTTTWNFASKRRWWTHFSEGFALAGLQNRSFQHLCTALSISI